LCGTTSLKLVEEGQLFKKEVTGVISLDNCPPGPGAYIANRMLEQ